MNSLTPLNPKPEPIKLKKLGPEQIERPEIVSLDTKLKFNRFTAEEMFKRAKFDDSDFDEHGYVTITEILRVAKPGEPATFHHLPTGLKFCVDHYECDGVIL